MSVMTKLKSTGLGIPAAALLGSIFLVPAGRADLISVSQLNGEMLPNVSESAGYLFGAPEDSVSGPGVANASSGSIYAQGTGGTGSESAGPSVAATVYDNTFTQPFWYAGGSIVYAFEITGPDVLSTTALVDVWTDGSASGEGAGQASAIFSISDWNGNSPSLPLEREVQICYDYYSTSCYPTSYTSVTSSFSLHDQQVAVTVGDVIVVQAIATADATGYGSYYAYVDPEIRLDPSDPPGLSLVFSPGIQQPGSSPPVSSVPEPSTVGLLSVGVALVACRLLGKRTIKRQSR